MDLLQACCDSRKLLNEILSSIRDVIIVTDIEGHIFFSNSVVEKVLGFKPDELNGENLSKIFTREDLQHLYPNLLQMARKNMPFKGELKLQRKDGSPFFAFLVFRSYHDPREDRIIIAVCIHDIDKEKGLEKVFRESHYEDFVQIANGIAHEIRNPLMGIGGFIRRLFKSGKVTGNQDKYYEYIISNLKKIEGLVEKVEYFAGLPLPCLSEQPVNKLLQKAAGSFSGEIEKRRIDLTIHIQDMVLLLDKDLITKVFSILIANALDATSDGGKIMIYSETDGIHGRIYLTDTGSGISQNDMPHIFNPFFSTKPDGAGIDLATAKRIVESHGGQIQVKSTEGIGTTFILVFPLERRQSIRILPLVPCNI